MGLRGGTALISLVSLVLTGVLTAHSPATELIPSSPGLRNLESNDPFMKSAPARAKKSLLIKVNGLPKGSKANVIVTGPKGFKKTVDRTRLLTNLKPGMYRIKSQDMRIGKRVFRANQTAKRIQIRRNSWGNVRVTYLLPLRFNLKKLAGVAVTAAPKSRASAKFVSTNLIGFDKAGTEVSALLEGVANIKHVVVGPDDNLYVEFISMTVLNGSGDPCILAIIARVTGKAECIDAEIGSVLWPTEDANSDFAGAANLGLQFDAAGNLYFQGATSTGLVIRKWSAGVLTTLVSNPTGWLTDFLVLDSGEVLYIGNGIQSDGQWTTWMKSISPSGTERVVALASITYLRQLPDGYVYFGSRHIGKYHGNNWSGVRRYDPASGKVEDQFWIGASPLNSESQEPEYPGSRYSSDDLCLTALGVAIMNCGVDRNGTTVGGYTDLGGSGFFIVGIPSFAFGHTIAQYSPRVLGIASQIARVTKIISAGDRLAVAGSYGSGESGLTLLDPNTGAETVLLGADSDIQIRSLDFSASENSLYFEGTQKSDQSNVIGVIPLTTLFESVSELDVQEVTDFEVFN